MDLAHLEDLVGIKYESCTGREVLSSERWKLVKRVGRGGKTLLMEAAEGGDVRCVDLLLRCGVDVNARDGRGRRAIDHAMDIIGREQLGGTKGQVILLLLQRDSLLPDDTGREERFEALIQEDEGIERLFAERDRFHDFVRKGDVKAMEDTLRNSECSSDGPRYWVDREGRTALYVSGYEQEFEAWALLKSQRFELAGEQERGKMENLGESERREIDQAMGKYFTSIPNVHLYKMLWRTKVLGSPGGMATNELLAIYEKVDEVPMTSLLLQCLQDEPRFEVIFDLQRSDIRCTYAGCSGDGLRGVLDPLLDRVYASGGVAEGFEESDRVSNLVHELTHKAMFVLFKNGGLPYKEEDSDNEKIYKKIVANILSGSRLKKCDKIIQRVVSGYPPQLHQQELIVRVPEIVSYYNIKKSDISGIELLETQVKDLLEYYSNHVIPEMERYIRDTRTVNVIPTSNFLTFLTSNHKTDRAQVLESIGEPEVHWHDGLRVLRVSNLSLGVSHLEKALDGLVVCDWRRYEKHEDILNTQLARGNLKHVAVVWQEDLNEEFQSICRDSDGSNVANIWRAYNKSVTLVIPKTFSVPESVKPVEYLWKDLSSESKAWLLGKTVNFQGRDASLKKVIGGAVGKRNAEVTLDRMLDADGLALLIDGENFTIGRPVVRVLKERRQELLRDHQQCFIPRVTKVRQVELSGVYLESRPSDAFFVCNADAGGLREEGICAVYEWDRGRGPGETRCFLLDRLWNLLNEDPQFKRVIDELRGRPCPGANEGRGWQYAHFFRCEDTAASHRHQYVHLRSEEVHPKQAAIIAGAPGSGKTVIANTRALGRKTQCPGHWVEMLELSDYEESIGNWNRDDFKSKEKVENLLFQLIRGRETKSVASENLCLEKNIFKLFCHSDERMLIYFDGFDEICPRHKETFTSFLEAMLDVTRVKFVVTTRVHECAGLEKSFSVPALVFVPMSRKEQLIFFVEEWKARLQSLKEEHRVKKVESIISILQENVNADSRNEITKIVDSLKMLCEENDSSVSQDVDLYYLAKQLINSGRSVVVGEGNLCETPINAWILASVAFETNFNLKICLSLNELYKRFSEIKIEMYSREKAKTSGRNVADAMAAMLKSSTHALMKTYSAFFFLRDESCRLTSEDIHEMQRVGLLAQRGNSTVFVHRTIGEYFLSLWLLEKANEGKVTRIIMSRILLEKEFAKTRQFMDDLLTTARERRSSGSSEGGEVGMQSEVSLLNQSAFPVGEGEPLMSLQKCVFKSISERNGGIFQYLAENSKGMLPDVVFGDAGWDVRSLDVVIRSYCRISRWNALTLWGECVRWEVETRDSNANYTLNGYLKFLQKMLNMIEEHGLVENLKGFMSTFGLQWMCIEVNDLWKAERGRAQFKWLFEFLVRNKCVLGETLRTTVLDKEGEELLQKSVFYAFDIFEYILDLIVEGEQLNESLLEGGNILEAWAYVIRYSGVNGVGRMWRYLEGKLEAEEKGRFLQRKNRRKRNALFLACFQKVDPDVFPFVWGLVRKEFDDEGCKRIIMDSFNGVEGNSNKFDKSVFLVWLFGLLEDGFLDGDEVTRLLLSRNHEDRRYVLKFHWHPPTPPFIHKLQQLLLAERLRTADIVRSMEGHYMGLTRSCFFLYSAWFPSEDADFISSVESEWEALLPSLSSSPLVDAIPRIDQHSFVPHLSHENGERLNGLRSKAFLVLLERQLRLEEGILGREGLLERVKGEWWRIPNHFPLLRTRGDGGGRGTKAPLVPLSFAVISKFLAKERVAEILLHQHSQWGTVFHFSLRRSDPRAFLSLYDVARWSMGDGDALWRVHSAIWRRWGEGERTVLELLLEAQERGLFAFTLQV